MEQRELSARENQIVGVIEQMRAKADGEIPSASAVVWMFEGGALSPEEAQGLLDYVAEKQEANPDFEYTLEP